jgi:hypothetical protein
LTETRRQISTEAGRGVGKLNFMRVVGQAVRDKAVGFLESLLVTALLARAAGFTGLVITIDEFEVESQLTKEKINRLVNVLSLLTRYLRNESGYAPAPLAIFVAAVGDADEEDLSSTALRVLLGADPAQEYHLSPWGDRDLLTLAGCIDAVYRQAYPSPQPGNGQAEKVLGLLPMDLEVPRVRAFARSYLAALDAHCSSKSRD